MSVPEIINVIIKLQADLILRFDAMGASPNLARTLAQEAVHHICISDVVKPEIKDFYLRSLEKTKDRLAPFAKRK